MENQEQENLQENNTNVERIIPLDFMLILLFIFL